MGVLSHLFSLSAIVAAVSAAPAPAPVTPTALELRSGDTALSPRAQAINYNQDYIAGGANVQYSPNQGAGTFTISYNTQADFVVGLGWQPGDSNPITFSGSFTASGVGIVTIYGWSTNPLVEYYIMENPIGYPKSGTQKGTVTSDGSSYEVWLHQQVNQPSIQGTSTFNQFISIRSSPRNSGTVTVANHFNAWAGFGMNLGTLNYQVLAVESWSGSGSGSFTVSKGTSTGSSPPATSSTSPGTGTGTGSGGNCAALYGQCGGQGWTGATCCSSGTCKASNTWYSQCL